MKIIISNLVEDKLEEARQLLCQNNQLVPCISFGIAISEDKHLDSNGEKIFIMGALDPEAKSGGRLPILFNKNSKSYALLPTDDILVFSELHFDIRDGRIVNIA